jgi:hypothetical protein
MKSVKLGVAVLFIIDSKQLELRRGVVETTAVG